MHSTALTDLKGIQ